MSRLICISNRKICQVPFIKRLVDISKTDVYKIILREKDLSSDEYKSLAKELIDTEGFNKDKLILHTYYEVAIELGIKALHMPLGLLEDMKEENKKKFDILGASCHSVEDALRARNLGCTYITAGHVFDTDCKKGLPGRGLDFLQEVCEAVDIPVYAIGGIKKDNIQLVEEKGAYGVCIMSGYMGTVL